MKKVTASVFYFLIFLFSATSTSAQDLSSLIFAKTVPQEIKHQMLDDLKHLRNFRGSAVSRLHREVFDGNGPNLNGASYYDFFLSRVTQIDVHPSQKDFFVTAGGADHPKTLFVSPEYVKYRGTMSSFERLAILIHEARHNESGNHWPHSVCPTPFVDLQGKAIVAPWGQNLAGKLACDREPLGSYGITYVMAHNVNKACTNCSAQEKHEAGTYAESILLRITDSAARAQLLRDQ